MAVVNITPGVEVACLPKWAKGNPAHPDRQIGIVHSVERYIFVVLKDDPDMPPVPFPARRVVPVAISEPYVPKLGDEKKCTYFGCRDHMHYMQLENICTWVCSQNIFHSLLEDK